MAIKISGVTVINNSRELENLTGASGTFGDFHPDETTITSASSLNISMLVPIQKVDMTGNVAFTCTNKAFGRDVVLILDTTATPHTPSFDSSVEFPGGEPTWTGYRHWTITLMCWNGTNVRATAIGFDDAGSAPSGGLPSTFSQFIGFDTSQTAYTAVGIAQAWASVSFEHEPASNRIKVGWWSATNQYASATTYTYVNYTALTNITSVQFQYNVSGQNCSGVCDAASYSGVPTPAAYGYSSGTYYNGYVRFWWAAYANSTTTNTVTGATFNSSDPDFRIRVICDQGTLYSTCELSQNYASLVANYGMYKGV